MKKEEIRQHTENWNEFYSQVLNLENNENIKVPELRLYLQSIYKLSEQFKNEKVTLELIYKILKMAFIEEPIEFNNEWLKIKTSPEKSDYPNDLDYLKQVLLFEISELKKIESNEIENEFKFFGITSETGNTWYNFSPFDNLECGIRGFIANIPFSRVDPVNITWITLADIIEIGRIYE